MSDSSTWGADDQQIPLAVKYHTKPIWGPVRSVFGLDATGAAIAVVLYEAHMLGDGEVAYSRRKGYYAGRTCHPLMTYRQVITAADWLDRQGLIQHFRQSPGQRGWQSWMAGKPELITGMQSILANAPKMRLILPREPIMLRDCNGVAIPTKQTRELERMQRRIEQFNEAITSLDIIGDNGVSLAAPMVRIFNGELARGGRFYATGTSWQNVKADMRRRIAIDGEQVVELDFSSLHPAMLYAEAGATMPADCYDISPWPRDIVKLGVLVLINAKSEHTARLAIAHKAVMRPLAEPGSQQAMRFAQDLIDDIKRTHQPIAHAFHSDAGARLMRQDSELAERVMMLLARQGIVALPVHDSFLVPASKRDQLEAAMLEAAHAIGLHQIRVKASA